MEWNIEPIIDMKAAIFNEIVIYGWDELQTHISLNDIIGDLNRQQKVLQRLGMTGTDSKKTTKRAISNIINMGYFGFLCGVFPNFLQIWTFLVCFYVSICFLSIHWCPIGILLFAINIPNAITMLKLIATKSAGESECPSSNNLGVSLKMMQSVHEQLNLHFSTYSMDFGNSFCSRELRVLLPAPKPGKSLDILSAQTMHDNSFPTPPAALSYPLLQKPNSSSQLINHSEWTQLMSPSIMLCLLHWNAFRYIHCLTLDQVWQFLHLN